MAVLRSLVAQDLPAFEHYCAADEARTLFFASNQGFAPLGTSGSPRAGSYMGAFEGRELVGLAAHYEMGSLVVGPGRAIAALSLLALQSTRGPCTAIVGPSTSVASAIEAVADKVAPPVDVGEKSPDSSGPSIEWALNASEGLYQLSLDRVQMPESPDRARARPASPRDLDTIIDWGVDYEREALGREVTMELRDELVDFYTARVEEESIWVLERGDTLVAMTSFNAQTPTAVQVGGVWTPPELRGRGYARSLVAAHLAHARDHGAGTGILFTQDDNHAAIRAYLAIGFERIGDWRLALPRAPMRLREG